MDGARRCLLVACLLVAAASSAQLSGAATAADQGGLLTSSGRQLLGGTHVRQFQVIRCPLLSGGHGLSSGKAAWELMMMMVVTPIYSTRVGAVRSM
jgi:hypothetical protein